MSERDEPHPALRWELEARATKTQRHRELRQRRAEALERSAEARAEFAVAAATADAADACRLGTPDQHAEAFAQIVAHEIVDEPPDDGDAVLEVGRRLLEWLSGAELDQAAALYAVERTELLERVLDHVQQLLPDDA